MMDINLNSPADVRSAGLQVLAESLGPVGFTRFIQQFENGYGDYTKEKYSLPRLTFDDLDVELQKYL